jgi:hypothetical protein
MAKKCRVEIYDEIKSNDLTLYFENVIDSEQLAQIIFSNIRRFSGNVRAFAVDLSTKKKSAAAILPMETVSFYKSRLTV